MQSLCVSPSVRVGERDVLPLLLEELPHLHVPPAALDKMWKQQLQHVERLHASSLPQRSTKLEQEVGGLTELQMVVLVKLVLKEFVTSTCVLTAGGSSEETQPAAGDGEQGPRAPETIGEKQRNAHSFIHSFEFVYSWLHLLLPLEGLQG